RRPELPLDPALRGNAAIQTALAVEREPRSRRRHAGLGVALGGQPGELDAAALRVDLGAGVRGAGPLVAGREERERPRDAHQHSSFGTGTGIGTGGGVAGSGGGVSVWPGWSGGPSTTVISA